MLVLLTIVVIFQVTSGPGGSTQAADSTEVTMGPMAPASSVAVSSAAADSQQAPPPVTSVDAPVTPGAVPDLTITDADGHLAGSITAAALPAGPDFIPSGAGTWHVVPGTTAPVGTGERTYTYTVEVEDGLQAVEQDAAFATAVDATLADPRSWIGGGQVTLSRIDNGDPDFRISLTSQMTVRSPDQCGWDIPLEASCFNGYAGRVFINDARWIRGAMSYGGDLAAYRSYAVNHEVGHALGMRHEPCPGTGQPAPVMMQQSWSTSDDDLSLLDPQTIPRDGNTCAANPYPFPSAAVAAPAGPVPSAAAG